MRAGTVSLAFPNNSARRRRGVVVREFAAADRGGGRPMNLCASCTPVEAAQVAQGGPERAVVKPAGRCSAPELQRV